MKRSAVTGDKIKRSPVIVYKWKGINCMRAKGKTGKQALVAKQQASILGKASRISARLRACFKTILGKPTDRPMMYRLNNALQQWLRTGAANKPESIDTVFSLEGFYFYGANADNPFPEITLRRGNNGKILLKIPAIRDPEIIIALSSRRELRIVVCFASCDLSEPENTVGFETEIRIPSNELPVSVQEIEVPLLPGPGKLLVAAVSINRTYAWIAGAIYN